jgi:hypothetical protein
MRPQRLRLALPALLLALAAASAPAARADAIDKALYDKAPEVMKFLKDKDYKNVGVLRFQLKKGKGKVTYSGGVINGNMATRLENALLMETDPKNPNPIGIIRDAGAVAAAKAPAKHWDESNAKERAALFDYDYPLAWGNKTVKADAFLVGGVKLSEDMKTTTVFITCFDRKSDKDHEVCRLEVTTDRTILADAGQSYVLARGLVKKRSAEIDPKTGENKDGKSLQDLMNDDASKSAKDRDDKKGSGLANEYVDFEVTYDDQPQAVTGDPNDGGELRIAPPQTGQTVAFRCTNKTSDKIGLVVYVNGKSTLQYQTEPADNCRRWILPADRKDYWIQGYHDENDVRTKFKIVDPDDALVKNELADKLGQIEVVVFLMGQKSPPVDTQEILVSSRGLRSPSPTIKKRSGMTQKPKTAVEARSLVFKSMGMKVPDHVRPVAVKDRGAGYIVPDPSLQEKVVIDQLEFPNPTQVATPIVIRYNDKPAN